MNYEKKWRVLPEAGEEFFLACRQVGKDKTGYNRLILQLLYNRGIQDSREIKNFLEADRSSDHDPFLFQEMEKAVDSVIEHIKKGNKIYIYGDYDADGITSSALLFTLLKKMKADVAVYIPDRVSEGYGLNKEAIDEIKKQGGKLIITVDTGIRNKPEVEYAQEQGLDVVVTDHHMPPEEKKDLPDCPLINPLVEDSGYPFGYLAGVGVAFKLGQALVRKSTLSDEQKDIMIERLLDLVAIGTITDCVTLLGENRILVKKGMKVLNHTKRVGLQELVEVAQINNKKLQAWNVGFQLGPRLNASSRMDHADGAFYLLVSEDKKEAREMAKDLNNKNITRQKDTELIFDEASQGQDQNSNRIIVAVSGEGKEWSEGIIGLVASRLSERYYKPALVITKGEEGYKGSGRSIDEFNIIEALEECSDVLEKYGGHAKACGFSVSEENLQSFIDKITRLANKKLRHTELVPTLRIDAELSLDKIDEDLFNQIEKMAPFGQDNPKPQFLSREVEIRDIVRMGKNGEHIKFRLDGLWALSFNHKEKWQHLRIGDTVDVVYYIDMNEFNGKREVQLKIIDISRNT